MVSAWLLLAALAVGAAAGWLLRGRLGAATLPAPPAPASAPAAESRPEPAAEAPEEAAPAEKMGAVLSELERRYQGRTADAEPSRPRAPRRTRRPPGG